MSIAPINSYNHNNLINNPPHITNFPLIEYMEDNTINYQKGQIELLRKAKAKSNAQDNFISGLFTFTFAAVVVVFLAIAGRLLGLIKHK